MRTGHYHASSAVQPMSGTSDSRGEPDRLDERLHYSRAWHRHGYVFRSPETGRLRILDAWSAPGPSGIHAAVECARLNPGAEIRALRDSEATNAEGIPSCLHDPREPLPADWGPFDFVVCRGGLDGLDDPVPTLRNLAAVLDPSGLLFATFPNRRGRAEIRALRQAIDALSPVAATPDQRHAIGLELFHALRVDHPIRIRAMDLEEEAEPFVARALANRRDWTLDEAIAQLAPAGLQFLHAATPWRWRPDRVFDMGRLAPELHRRIDRLPPGELSQLVDALDASLLNDDYGLFACPLDHVPAVPSWPRSRLDQPSAFDRLVPHLTGLASPAPTSGAGSQSRVIYRTVSGALGEIDRLSNLLLSSVDGVLTCGDIERRNAAQIRASDDAEARQRRWIELADAGLIVLGDASGR